MSDEMIPQDVIEALSALNAHARAYGCGRDTIYAYKLFAAMLGVEAGVATARPVGVMASCHGCLGTGRFFCQYEGQTSERCRKCAGTGRVYLRFAETTIHGHAWHHPLISGGYEILYKALGTIHLEYDTGARALIVRREGRPPEEIAFGSVGDWQPNRPGARLATERAAELLNCVETWLYQVRVPADAWKLETARRAASSYHLDLGRLGTRCHFCGDEKVRLGRGYYSKWFHWSVPVCEAHEDRDDASFPEQAMTPEIAKWRASRESIPDRMLR